MAGEREKWGEPFETGQYPFWNPHHKTRGRRDGRAGDELIGTVTAIREAVNRFGKKQYYIDFENARATLNKKDLKEDAFTLVLSQAHSRIVTKLAEGDEYRVLYRGPKDVGKQNPMADFEVRPAIKLAVPF